MTKKMSRGKKGVSRSNGDPGKHFGDLMSYMAKVAKGSTSRHSKYSLCVKASVTKCFEFNLANRRIARFKDAFFAMASLRGICEDLIVLRYIGRMPSKDREQIIAALSQYDNHTRMKLQHAFFAAVRPQQPVLRAQNDDTALAASELAARRIWNQHGWPNLQKGAMPQVRQIAEKQGLHQLAVLYDYVYRLTSGSVHFNV
jgi:hypothetical protein